MDQPPPKTGHGFSPALRPLIFAVIACVIVAVLFAPFGVIYRHADLSFLTAPFIIYFVLRLLSRLSSIYLPPYIRFYHAEAAACFLNGLAFALFFYLLLDNAALFTRIGGMDRIEGFLTGLSAAAGGAVLFILGRTASRLGEIYRITSWGKPLYPAANALGQFFTGLGFWRFLAAFSATWSPFSDIGLIIFAGVLAVAVANIGHYGEGSKNPFIADASAWLQRAATLEFFIGAFIATYILFVRPLIIDLFRYAAIVEWAIILFIGWRLFSGIKNGLKIRCAVEVHDTDWQKHVQLINSRQGGDFPQLGEMQAAFVEDGSRDALLIYLALLLHNNKTAPEEITRILHPLINHRDEKMPWFAFSREQRQIMKKNEQNRRLILGEIMANLNYIMNPANQNIKEHTDEKNKPG